MSGIKKNKRVLVKVKDLDEKELDAAINTALDSLFGKDEDEEPVPVEEVIPAGKKPSTKKPKNAKRKEPPPPASRSTSPKYD